MSGAPHAWQDVRTFCLFVGYGRSGHSIIGSLIDAHPQAVVAHELNAVKRFFAGVSRDALFDEIFALAQLQARDGRHASRVDGGAYVHRFDGQIKYGVEGITLLGDKKGAGTAYQFARRGFEHIERFKEYVGLPVKILHVVRNPFDMVAAGMVTNRFGFHELLPVVAAIRERSADTNWLDIYYEDVLAQPREEMTRVLQFLELPVLPAHLAQCARHLFRAPHRRRFEIAWPAGGQERVAALIARHDFLARYSWES